ncbi:MAG: futalosine hydrolase [Planctomycetota bacterium]
MASKTLILVPTEMERAGIESVLQSHGDDYSLELCGFGLVAAAIHTAQAIRDHQPPKVVLAGIAGAISDSIAVGTATSFNRVTVDGIGIGEGDAFRSATEMGWEDQAGASEYLLRTSKPTRATLISVASASTDAAMAERRFIRHSHANHGMIAEDMEGYAVAMACDQAGVPLTIVRGISNQAGDRDRSNWQIDSALQAAAEMARMELV